MNILPSKFNLLLSSASSLLLDSIENGCVLASTNKQASKRCSADFYCYGMVLLLLLAEVRPANHDFIRLFNNNNNNNY